MYVIIVEYGKFVFLEIWKMSEVKTRIGFEEFVNVWESSESVDEVCESLGMKKANAYARAAKYRSENIPLKKYTGGGGGTRMSADEKMEILARVRNVAVDVIHQESVKLADSRVKPSEDTTTVSQEGFADASI